MTSDHICQEPVSKYSHRVCSKCTEDFYDPTCSNIRISVQTKSEDYTRQCPKTTSLHDQHTNTHNKILIPHLETREPVLELVDDVLIGDPAHVQVAFEGRVTVFNSLIIDQILKTVTRPDLLLSNASVAFLYDRKT